MGHKFKPQNWERLMSDERRALLDPDRFLDQLDIKRGDVTADIGAGPGFFTLPLAERVGPRGKVYALDVAPEMVAQLRLLSLPAQVEVLLSMENRLPLPDGIVDVALLAFVLHELDKSRLFLADVRRILRPAGRLVVLEWVPQEEQFGPPLHERIASEDSARALVAAGFRVLGGGTVNASAYYHIAAADHHDLTPAHPESLR